MENGGCIRIAIGILCILGGLIALVEAALGHRHDLVLLRERRDLMTPVEPEAADAVDQHQQRPFAGRVIVDPHAARQDVPLLQATLTGPAW